MGNLRSTRFHSFPYEILARLARFESVVHTPVHYSKILKIEHNLSKAEANVVINSKCSRQHLSQESTHSSQWLYGLFLTCRIERRD
jgi:hypothetical protein